jgi:integron integrase
MPRKRRTDRAGDPFAWFRNPTRPKGEANAVEPATSQKSPGAPTNRGILTTLRAVLRRKHYSRETEKAYVSWVRRFVRYHGLRHPRAIGEAEITKFLEHLAVDRHVSASTQNQALAALIFFYRNVLRRDLKGVRKSAAAKQRRRLPVVVTPDEARRIIERIDGPSQLVVSLLYGSGLRLREALQLRLKDVDFDGNALFIRSGKGQKDRMALLPNTLVDALKRQIEFAKQQHASDLASGAGWVDMPDALGRKFRRAGQSIRWQWLFPATRIYHHRETGQLRRHHLHPSVVQKKVQLATRAAGIMKRVTCHTFRHSFATTLLNMNYDIRTIQKLLGHKSVETTMIYTHLLRDALMRVKSPMDLLGAGNEMTVSGAPPAAPSGVDTDLRERMEGFEKPEAVDWEEDEFDDEG